MFFMLLSGLGFGQEKTNVAFPDDSTVMTLIYDEEYKTPESYHLSDYHERFKGQILQTYYECVDSASHDNQTVNGYAKRLKYQVYQIIEDDQYVYYDMMDTSGLDRKSIIHRYPKCEFMNINWDNRKLENELLMKFENLDDTVLTVNKVLKSFDAEQSENYYFEKDVEIGFINPELSLDELVLVFNDLWWEDYGSQKGSGGVKLFSFNQEELENSYIFTYIYNTSIGGDWGLADQFYLWSRTLSVDKVTGKISLNLKLIKKYIGKYN